MLSFLRCVLCCDDEINTGHSYSEIYTDESSSQSYAVPYNYDTFSRTILPDPILSTQTATRTQSDNYSTTVHFPKKSNTPSVYNQPKQTLPRINVKVGLGVNPKKPPDVPTATHTNVNKKSTSSSFYLPLPPPTSSKLGSSSSSPFGAIPGSPESPSVSMKPILARAVSTPTTNQTKSQYNVVEKGSTPLYVIPEDIKGLIMKDIVPGVLMKPLSPQTYKDYFATLLYAEDYYLEKWDNFEMGNVTLKLHEAEVHGRKGKSKHKNNDQKDEKIFVEFEVDSIPEKRPYLLSRDFVSVRPTGREVDPFQSMLKRAHQAIAAASDMLFTEFLFPDCRPRSSYSSEKDFFAEKSLLSRHQIDLNAIGRIINLNGPPAYLLKGPLSVNKEKQMSRTGMVVRDAVVQLCQASSHNRILICARTNSTCDVFMRSLQKEVGYSNIFRANAAFRELDGVPVDILPFCPYKEKEELFTCPSLPQLLKFKVILSTFMSSFRLYNEGIKDGHFTHIILVDASSVIEPEILVPLTKFTNVSTNVVVTGAPSNRFRWVRSDIAWKNGLSTSYFKRLRESELYWDLDPEFITQLEDVSSSSSSHFR